MKFDKTVKRLLKESEQPGPPYIEVTYQQQTGWQSGGKVTRYYKDPKKLILHREDGPAVIAPDCTAWYIDNHRHRLDGPAYETTDGYKGWYANGQRHRVDGPAVIFTNGDTEWWVNGAKQWPEQIEELKKKIAVKQDIQSHKNNRIDPEMLEDYL